MDTYKIDARNEPDTINAVQQQTQNLIADISSGNQDIETVSFVLQKIQCSIGDPKK